MTTLISSGLRSDLLDRFADHRSNPGVKPVVKSLLLKFRPAKKFCSGPAVGLVVLWLKADQHQGGTVTNARYGSDAPGDPERVKLLAGHRFNHPVQFFEV